MTHNTCTKAPVSSCGSTFLTSGNPSSRACKAAAMDGMSSQIYFWSRCGLSGPLRWRGLTPIVSGSTRIKALAMSTRDHPHVDCIASMMCMAFWCRARTPALICKSDNMVSNVDAETCSNPRAAAASRNVRVSPMAS